MPDAAALFEAPALLTDAHDSARFESGEPVLDAWLRQRAWGNQQRGASRTYVVCRVHSVVVAAYASLSVGQILAQDVPGSMRRNMPRFIPAVVLGRLAVALDCEGSGLGGALLADMVRRARLASAAVSARLVIVHAISPAAAAFYLRHGLLRLPVDTPTLALDLVKLRKVAGDG